MLLPRHGTAVNITTYASLMAGPAAEAWNTCHCAVEAVLLCIEGQCTLCGSGSDEPPECGDGGTRGEDAGVGEDSGVIGSDGGVIGDGGVTPPGDCPDESTIVNGRPCATEGLECTAPYSCPSPYDTTQCACTSSHWDCEYHHCPEQPQCEVGASCAGTTAWSCTMTGAGPCGSDVYLVCQKGTAEPTYIVESFPCSSTGTSCGWGNTTNGCSESCSCENGSMVCTGDCPDGGLASP